MSGQSTFAAALTATDATTPPEPGADLHAELQDGRGRPAGRRFAVYRNNVTHSLTEALEQTFPTVLSLLGEENFRAIARIYLRQEPPSSPILSRYGAGFAGFLDGFEPLAHLPYLGDSARLDRALVDAYHAADATALTGADLAAIAPGDLPGLRLALAPACRVLTSPWPIHAIWRFNQPGGGPQPGAEGETVLIVRPGFDPVPRLIAPADAAFVRALAEGQPLGQAAATAGPDFDLATLLSQLLSDGALVHAMDEECP